MRCLFNRVLFFLREAWGPAGTKGTKGDSGNSSTDGQPGEPGDQCEPCPVLVNAVDLQVIAGPRGEVGAPGLAERGLQGSRGVNGTLGPKGARGSDGAKGEKGEAWDLIDPPEGVIQVFQGLKEIREGLGLQAYVGSKVRRVLLVPRGWPAEWDRGDRVVRMEPRGPRVPLVRKAGRGKQRPRGRRVTPVCHVPQLSLK
ncbi:hypothetical protein COCON_G00000060 [Conger conger]|uniref:Collagen n=1 Tax=Conger conger TaxID=82655 RepID=A0A9Q1E0F2_CONCO|nr:hypothetical protein COCON_G00000060 [Conger conger]